MNELLEILQCRRHPFLPTLHMSALVHSTSAGKRNLYQRRQKRLQLTNQRLGIRTQMQYHYAITKLLSATDIKRFGVGYVKDQTKPHGRPTPFSISGTFSKTL